MGKNNINTFEEIQQSLNSLRGNVHILEASIPIEKQKAYFEYAKKVMNSDHSGMIEKYTRILYSNETSLDEKKYAMVFLSVSRDIKAFRVLEEYNNKYVENELTEWAILSLLQAKMILENEFSDEKQIFVSTGLGGKGNKFRFFAFFKSVDLKSFSEYQRNLIEKETSFFIHKYQGQIEKIEIEDNYFTLLFLSDFQTIRNAINSFVEECNKYGNFINSNFIVTNMQILREKDIQEELQK